MTERRNMHRLLPSLLAALAILLPAQLVADVIVLKNGNRIRGRVIAKSASSFVLELPYGEMTIPARQVESVIPEDEDDYLRKTGEELIERDTELGLDFLRAAWRENPNAEAGRRALLQALLAESERLLGEGRTEGAATFSAEARTVAPDAAEIAKFATKLREAETSRDDLIARATAARESGRWEEAYTLLKGLVHRFPETRAEQRRLWAESATKVANQLLLKERFAEASICYQEALRQEPDLISILELPLTYAEARAVVPLLQKNEFRAARERLLPVHDLLPEEPSILYHLALATEGAGDLSEAARLYAKLAGPEHRIIDGEKHLVDLRRRAEQRLLSETSTLPADPRWRDEQGATSIHESRSFSIRHRNKGQAKEVERYLEHHLSRLCKRWFQGEQQPQFRSKIDIYLHASSEELRTNSKAPSWSNGYTAVERRYGAVFSTEIHFNTAAPQFLSASIPHELAHAMLPYVLGGTQAYPPWLEEGVATSEESPFKQEYFQRIVAEALEDGTIFPLETLFGATAYPDDARVSLFYAQSNSIVSFLRSRCGARNLFPILRALAVGELGEALPTVTPYATVADLERDWKKWLTNSQSD